MVFERLQLGSCLAACCQGMDCCCAYGGLSNVGNLQAFQLTVLARYPLGVRVALEWGLNVETNTGMRWRP